MLNFHKINNVIFKKIKNKIDFKELLRKLLHCYLPIARQLPYLEAWYNRIFLL